MTFTVRRITPGDYRAAVQLQGFRTQTQSGVRLDANQNVHVSFTLQPGTANQTATVTASPRLVDTRESQLGETVDLQRIQDLPLTARNVYSRKPFRNTSGAAHFILDNHFFCATYDCRQS